MTHRVVYFIMMEPGIGWRRRGPELCLTGHHVRIVVSQFVKLVLCEPLLPVIHGGGSVTWPDNGITGQKIDWR